MSLGDGAVVNSKQSDGSKPVAILRGIVHWGFHASVAREITFLRFFLPRPLLSLFGVHSPLADPPHTRTTHSGHKSKTRTDPIFSSSRP